MYTKPQKPLQKSEIWPLKNNAKQWHCIGQKRAKTRTSPLKSLENDVFPLPFHSWVSELSPWDTGISHGDIFVLNAKANTKGTNALHTSHLWRNKSSRKLFTSGSWSMRNRYGVKKIGHNVLKSVKERGLLYRTAVPLYHPKRVKG